MLSIFSIIISIVLIVLILLQDRSTGTSGLLGGTAADASYQTRRGLERVIFISTIVAAILFAAIGIIGITTPRV